MIHAAGFRVANDSLMLLLTEGVLHTLGHWHWYFFRGLEDRRRIAERVFLRVEAALEGILLEKLGARLGDGDIRS